MALISSTKHGKGRLAGYLKQAKKLLHSSLDGDRKSKTSSEKAKVPREISEASINVVSKPAKTAAITGAHIADTEVVHNEECDFNYWAWNELPPIPSELPQPAKSSMPSAPKLKGQEPTVGVDTLLELATIGDSIAKIYESASNASPLSTTISTSATTSNTAIIAITTNSTPLTSDNLSSYNRSIWVSKSHLPLSSSSTFCTSSSTSFRSPPKRFQRSPFFGKKIGVTPRVSRISFVLGALDLEAPAFESQVSKESAGPTMVGGSGNEPEVIEPKERGFETFGGENGGRPFVVILQDLRTLLGHKPSSSIRSTSSPSLSHLSIEEGYAQAFAKITELRGYLGRR